MTDGLLCPLCRLPVGISLVYGNPTPDVAEAGGRGDVALAGRDRLAGDPAWRCVSCGMDWTWAIPPDRDPERTMRVTRIGAIGHEAGAVAIPHASRASAGDWLDATLIAVHKGARLSVELDGLEVDVTVDGIRRLTGAQAHGEVLRAADRPPVRLSAHYGIVAVTGIRTAEHVAQRIQLEIWLKVRGARSKPPNPALDLNNTYWAVLGAAVDRAHGRCSVSEGG